MLIFNFGITAPACAMLVLQALTFPQIVEAAHVPG